MSVPASITRILIANRGEIGRRIVRACRKLGLEAVAVYSDADRDAPFVREADCAVPIGPAPAVESYLNRKRILEAARLSGADAIHPGYGFLAENADFAEACAEAGLTFIGPSPEIIRRMGSKIEAKRLAAEAGVPIVPGYDGAEQSDEALAEAAEEVGFPLLLKASAGGGGRGMRVVRTAADLACEIRAARREAESAFGDGTLLVERRIENGRHVEAQIAGDRHGTVLHLFERDCSPQRNNQKVIEEAPAPGLAPELRAAMLDSAVKLAESVGYDSLGTVEFLVEPDRSAFHFLEMNTRLQVEHPVTEMVTGMDLVELQIRIARGEPLPFTQADVACAGHAFELRIAAEDPAESYRPETGRIVRYEEPEGEGIRVDSGVEAGSVVGHHYDSMLSKLIVRGGDREAALKAAVAALKRFRIDGIGTNRAFLRDLLELPDMIAGRHHTGSIAEAFPDGWQAPSPTPLDEALAVAARHLDARGQINGPWGSLGAWRVTAPAGRPAEAVYFIGERPVTVEDRGCSLTVAADGERIALDHVNLSDGVLTAEHEGLRHTIAVDRTGPVLLLEADGRQVRIEVRTLEEAHADTNRHGPAGGPILHAPMPGQVIEVRVSEGDEVDAGAPVVVLEAMKLMQTLAAPMAGRIDSLPVKPGMTVEAGAVIAVIAPREGTDE